MIILKKTKLKLKKQVWYLGIIIIFLGIGIYAAKNIIKDLEYQKTAEYKLLKIGYTKEELKMLEEKTNAETIDSLLTQEKHEFLLSLIQEKYYLKKHLNRYLNYHNEHKEYNSTKIISMVNTNNDYKYYDHDLDTDLAKDNLLIVNKYYHLNETYEPNDLININNKYYYGNDHKIRQETYEAFTDMWNEAQKEDIYLIINSSYRTFESQKNVYDDYKNSRGTTYADSIAARPGYSEHQTGLSLDIFSKEHTSTSNFKGSPAHTWLINNAYRFGFIERYQEDKQYITGFAAEAWHWRYVGTEAATYIYENNITFDEYYAYFVE